MSVNQNYQTSKFNQLWQLYCEQTTIHTDYTEACINFILEFLSQLITNLGWSEEQVSYVLSRKPLKTEKYSPQRDKIRAILVPSYKGIWRFDLGLNLWQQQTISKENLEPILLVIPISVRLTNPETKSHRFSLKVTDREYSSIFPCRFEIADENKSAGFEQAIDFIYERIKLKITEGINWSIEEQKAQQEKPFSLTLD